MLEGLEAYRNYAAHGRGDGRLWQQLTDLDARAVDQFIGELKRPVRENEFRLRSPGQAS
jgi:hypothetical protein